MENRTYLTLNFDHPPEEEKQNAAVYFTTIPCEPNTAKRNIGSHVFSESCLCANSIAYNKFGICIIFMCVYIISCAKNYVLT